MNNISTDNVTFKSAEVVFSKIKRSLKSLGVANLLDEGEFPVYTKEVLKILGLGVYKECSTIIAIEHYKGCLPDNFTYPYAIYKCTPNFSSSKGTTEHIQPGSFSFNIDITDQIAMKDSTGCCLDSCFTDTVRTIETITLKQYVTENNSCGFTNIIPLRLSPNVSPFNCSEDCVNAHNDSMIEVSIRGKEIFTNFTDACVYMKYYGFPVDENGDIEIPDIQQVETAIEWYIIYQVLLFAWLDSSIPDIQNKWIVTQQQYEKALATAKHYLKTPSFESMVNNIRNKRSQNSLRFFINQSSNTNFQRSF